VSIIVRDVVLPLADFALEATLELSARTTALYGPSGAGKTSCSRSRISLSRPRSS